MNNNPTGTKPKFSIYAKRKSGECDEAVLYMRIIYQFVTIDKSLCVKIPFNNWDSKLHQIASSPYHQKKMQEVFDEFKEKIMGAFYLLSQNTAEPTLREIMDMAFADSQKRSYSLLGVFSGLLLKMEKHNTQPRQRSNLRKHYSCMKLNFLSLVELRASTLFTVYLFLFYNH